MLTRVVQIEEAERSKDLLYEAGEIIKAGGLVAFPTETVYGLGRCTESGFFQENL